jgi:UTP--glucose-1-phosphate uridylyltransferase
MIKHAVIPVAGFGTRMLPAAKSVPKEMLPVLDRPTIQYVIEEAVAGGIRDVLLITSQGKEAIENHFRHHDRLEQRLRAGGKDALLASVNAIISQITLSSVEQPEQRGLGDAVHRARGRVNEPFLCMLGDTIFSGDLLPAQQLIDAHAKLGTAIIGLEEVPPEKVSRYGIVSGKMIEEGILRLDGLIEKPAAHEAPSNFAIAARYILTPTVFECLDRTVPGKGGEIQLTDALRLMLSREPIHGVILKSRRHDIGNPLDWLKTNLIFAARDAQLWEQIRPTIDALLADRVKKNRPDAHD